MSENARLGDRTMRRIVAKVLLTAAAVVVVSMVTGCQEQMAGSPKSRTTLFNGRDFAGWKLHVDDPNVNVDDIWSVRDGVVHCVGKPNGYMRTTKAYHDYKLHIEWRWAAEPTNSGVLLHAGGQDQVWPRCIEAQLKSGSAGDFVLIRYTGITVDGKEYGDPSKMFVSIPKKQASSEKPSGQWNSYDITCRGDEIRVYVNEVLQNEGVKATDRCGWICLQSEGSPIEFRNIYIEPLD